MPEHTYYIISPAYTPPKDAALIDAFTAPYYEATIDRMIYGVVICNRPLEPGEIAGSGLVSEPRE